MENLKKVLVIRFSSLGDILLTTPFLRVLKQNYPNVEIDYLVKNNFIDAVKHNPNLKNIFSWNNEGELERVIPELKENNYDLVVDLQNNLRSKKVVRKMGVQSVSYIKPNLKKFLLVHFKINLLKEIRTIPQRYIDTIPNLKLDNKGLQLFLPSEIKSKLTSKKSIIGFAPGAFHFTKRWPLEYFAELGKLLINEGFQIVLFGGKSDIEICKELQNKVPDSIDLSNNNKLLQTAADMKKCKLVVCNDSGLMHTATSVGIPVVSIFGSTVKEFGFAPFGVENLVLENKELSCRPCSHIGKSSCKKKHFNCMMEITPKMVFTEIKKFVSKI